MLLEHLCITARMGKRGKEEGGGINHYLLSEDTSGAPQCYHLAFEPIQLIKSTNYLFLLNPSFALINLPFLFGGFLLVSIAKWRIVHIPVLVFSNATSSSLTTILEHFWLGLC